MLKLFNIGVRDGFNIALAALQIAGLAGIDIEPNNRKTRPCDRNCQRQTDVSKPDDADPGGFGFNSVVQ